MLCDCFCQGVIHISSIQVACASVLLVTLSCASVLLVTLSCASVLLVTLSCASVLLVTLSLFLAVDIHYSH